MTEAEIWKYIAYVEAAVIVSIVSWWIGKERPRLAKMFKDNEERLVAIVERQAKIQTKTTAYLKDMYDRIGEAFDIHKDLKTHTEIDFDGKADSS